MGDYFAGAEEDVTRFDLDTLVGHVCESMIMLVKDLLFEEGGLV